MERKKKGKIFYPFRQSFTRQNIFSFSFRDFSFSVPICRQRNNGVHIKDNFPLTCSKNKVILSHKTREKSIWQWRVMLLLFFKLFSAEFIKTLSFLLSKEMKTKMNMFVDCGIYQIDKSVGLCKHIQTFIFLRPAHVWGCLLRRGVKKMFCVSLFHH